MKEFDELLRVMSRLRKECPWDKEQSIASLRTYLIEEAYECLDAMNRIELDGYEPLIDELGDILLQVIFQSELIGETTKEIAILKVVQNLIEKLKRRHPHIFGDSVAQTSAEVESNWEAIKGKERPRDSHLDGIPQSITALQRAFKLGKRSKQAQFDWETPEEVWSQFEDEITELEEAKTPEEIEMEFGDVLFCLAQWARKKNIDPEVALSKSNMKFERRFREIETRAKAEGKSFEEISAKEKELLWDEIKKDEALG